MSHVYHNGMPLSTYPDVLVRLGLRDGQTINEDMMWRVINENAGNLVSKVRKTEPSMDIDDLEAKVELNRMGHIGYTEPEHGLSVAVLNKISEMLKLKTA